MVIAISAGLAGRAGAVIRLPACERVEADHDDARNHAADVAIVEADAAHTDCHQYDQDFHASSPIALLGVFTSPPAPQR